MKPRQLSILSLLMLCVAASAAPAPLQLTNISQVIEAPANDLFAVTYGAGGKFIAVGTNKQILAGSFLGSQPFINRTFWTSSLAQGGALVKGKPSVNLLSSVAASSDLFLASGDQNIFYTSSSGTNFSAAAADHIFTTRAAVEGLAFNRTTFVAVAKAPQISRIGVNVATGKKWSAANDLKKLSYPESFRDVTPFGNGFAACGVFGVVRQSTDGNTWTLLRNGGVDEPDLLAIASYGNTLVCVGKPIKGVGGVIFTASNGGKFPDAKHPTFTSASPLYAVAHNGSAFVAVGKGGLVLVSADGNNWTSKTVSEVQSSDDLRGIAFATNGFLQGIGVAVGAKDSSNRATVLLLGPSPKAPEFIRYDTNICAGSNSPITMSISNSIARGVGSRLVAVEWFDQDANARITNGYAINEWKLMLETNLASEFILRPVLQTDNLTNLNQATVFNFLARAIDLRTGFVSETNRLTFTVFPRPTAMVFGSTNICNGQPATVRADLTGLGPWEVTWASNTIALPPITYAGPVALLPVNPYNPNLNQAFNHNHTVAKVVDKGSSLNCQAEPERDIVGAAIITNYPRPTAVVSGSTNICNGYPVTIRADLTGLGPWTITWASNGVALLPIPVPASPALLPATPFSPVPNMIFLHRYTVVALVDSGSPLNCSAEPESGDLRGTAIVTNFPRPTATVSGSTNVCNGQPVTVRANFTGLGPWQFNWVSNDVELPGPLTANTPAFLTSTQFSPLANAVFLHKYRVTNLVDLGSALQCRANPDEMSGTAIVSNYPRPTVTVSGSTNICNGQPATVRANFTGLGPWQFNWVSNDVELPGPLTANTPAFLTSTQFSPLANAVFLHKYRVTNLVDLGSASLQCKANPDEMSGTAIVSNYPRPTVTVSGSTNICNGQPATVRANFTGLGPWQFNWVSNDVVLPGPLTSNTPAFLTSTQFSPLANAVFLHKYRVTNLVDLGSAPLQCRANPDEMSGTAIVSNYPRPTVALSGSANVCNGQPATVRANFTGLGPWQFNWVSNDVVLPGPLTSNTPAFLTSAQFSLLPNAVFLHKYRVTNLVDLGSALQCRANPDEMSSSAIVTNYPRPTANITSGDTNFYKLTNFKKDDADNQFKKNIKVTVAADLTGIGPWDVTWSDGTNSFPKTYSTSPASYTFTVTVFQLAQQTNFTFRIVALNDNNCDALPGGLTGLAVASVDPRPGADVTGTNSICYGMSAQIYADFSGKLKNNTNLWPVLVWSDGFTQHNVSTNFLTRTLPTNTFANLAVASNYYFTVTYLSDTFTNTSDPNDLTGVAQITVYPIPTAPPVSLGDVTNCLNMPTGLRVSVPDGFTVDWFSDDTRTNLLLAGKTNFSVVNPVPGSNSYYAAVRFDTTNATCYFPSNTKVIFFAYHAPTAPPTSLGDVTNCVIVLTQLRVSVPASFTVDWFGDDTRTNLLISGTTNIIVSNPIPGTNFYYAAVRNTNNPACYFPANTQITYVTTNCTGGFPLGVSLPVLPALSMKAMGGSLSLQWYGSYSLQKSTNLAIGEWITVQPGATGTLNTCTMAVTNASHTGSAFFRLVPNTP